MMIIELPSGKIGVTFRHRMFDKPRFDSKTCDRFMNGITHCEVYEFRGAKTLDAFLIATGVGICKMPDAFCKAIGRKTSLTSALRKKWGPGLSRGFSRDDRIAIWEAYWLYTAPQTSQDTITDPHEAANILNPFPVTEALVGEIVGPVTGP